MFHYSLLHRLQYFARGSQTYHAQLAVALKGKSALELKDEQVYTLYLFCFYVCIIMWCGGGGGAGPGISTLQKVMS